MTIDVDPIFNIHYHYTTFIIIDKFEIGLSYALCSVNNKYNPNNEY